MYELHTIYVLIASIDRKNWVSNKNAYQHMVAQCVGLVRELSIEKKYNIIYFD